MIKNLWKEGKVLTFLGGACIVVSHAVTNPIAKEVLIGLGGLLIGSKDPKVGN